MRRYFIGLDMGGTNVRCGAVSSNGEVLFIRLAPAYATSTAEIILRSIVEQVRAVQEIATAKGIGRAGGIGVAVPGPLNLLDGTVVAAPHVAAWREFPLRRGLIQRLGRSVSIENDANAWAVGEFWRGAARGRKNVVLLTLGTGIGGGIIVDGKIVHGRLGMAGELGHVTVEPNGALCDCGARGCVETYASASGLRRMFLELAGSSDAKDGARTFGDGNGDFSVRQAAAAARSGNRAATEVFDRAGSYLGIAVASFVNIFDPELVVIGGGVSRALGLMKRAMMREIRARAIAFSLDRTRIVRAALGEYAGVIGAARIAMGQ